MNTPYIISKLNDKFLVHNPHPHSMEWEVLNTIEEAEQKLKEKNEQYLKFVKKHENNKLK